MITSLDVIEHFQESLPFLREIYRILAKDGLFFCTTPNGSSWVRRYLVPDREPTHINVHDQNFWRAELSNIGFNRIEIKGCVLYGLPPGMKIRQKSYIPSVVKPIFFPVYKLASELFIFARK